MKTAALEELEAALAASFDDDTLAVYADHLLAAGDPRGELIAIDMQIARGGSTAELSGRRTSILHAWLGSYVPSNPHGDWFGDSLDRGFLQDLHVGDHGVSLDELPRVLASPLGTYIRGITLRMTAPELARAFAQLATRRHAFLAHLEIIRTNVAPPLDDAVVHPFVDATPRLRRLSIRGNRVLRTFPHPATRELVVTGYDAIASLAPDDEDDAAPGPDAAPRDDAAPDRDAAPDDHRAEPLAFVESLDFAIDSDRGFLQRLPALERPLPGDAKRLLRPSMLPALRRLDLSRNEPELLGRYRDEYDGDYDYDDPPEPESPPLAIGDWLAQASVRSQLAWLRLPSIRSADEWAAIERALPDMRSLETLEIARGHYFKLPEKLRRYPGVRFVRPAPWPWPEPRQVQADALRIVAPRSQHEVEAHLLEAVAYMETTFERMPADARDAWTRFWHLVAALDGDRAGDRLSFPAALLLRALEVVELASWRELRMELRAYPLDADAMVTVERATVQPWG